MAIVKKNCAGVQQEFSYVSAFDVQLLSTLAANECHSELPLLRRQYIAVLAAKLCYPDTELAAARLENCDLSRAEPVEAIRQTTDHPQFSRRGAGDRVPNHLRTAPDGGEEFLSRRIWRAQLRLDLPTLEQAISAIIQSYSKEIQDALKQNNVVQYKKRVMSCNSSAHEPLP